MHAAAYDQLQPFLPRQAMPLALDLVPPFPSHHFPSHRPHQPLPAHSLPAHALPTRCPTLSLPSVLSSAPSPPTPSHTSCPLLPPLSTLLSYADTRSPSTVLPFPAVSNLSSSPFSPPPSPPLRPEPQPLSPQAHPQLCAARPFHYPHSTTLPLPAASNLTPPPFSSSPFSSPPSPPLRPEPQPLSPQAQPQLRDARPFHCPHCPTRFDRGGHLRVHIAAVHDKLRRFPCEEPGCRAAFGHNSSLLRHMKTFAHTRRPRTLGLGSAPARHGVAKSAPVRRSFASVR